MESIKVELVRADGKMCYKLTLKGYNTRAKLIYYSLDSYTENGAHIAIIAEIRHQMTRLELTNDG